MEIRKINVDRRENGAWMTDIPDMGDLRLKVRGVNNSDYRKLQSKLVETIPRQKKQRGQIDPDDSQRINLTLLCNTCLLDWENVVIDGVPVPFSKEKAHELMLEPEFEPFQEAVAWASRNVADQTDETVEDALGNSSRPSSGA
jgi:hypothetical protein